MLGVSKQAAERKYATKISAQPSAEINTPAAHFAQSAPPSDRSRTGELLRQRRADRQLIARSPSVFG
jgi:hypothetical protein